VTRVLIPRATGNGSRPLSLPDRKFARAVSSEAGLLHSSELDWLNALSLSQPSAYPLWVIRSQTNACDFPPGRLQPADNGRLTTSCGSSPTHALLGIFKHLGAASKASFVVTRPVLLPRQGQMVKSLDQ